MHRGILESLTVHTDSYTLRVTKIPPSLKAVSCISNYTFLGGCRAVTLLFEKILRVFCHRILMSQWLRAFRGGSERARNFSRVGGSFSEIV